MYKIRKTFEIAGAHQLKLGYDSPCCRLHGHNWVITVEITSKNLDRDGMILDFKAFKQLLTQRIHAKLDHQNLNKILSINPTAENISKFIFDNVNFALSNAYPEPIRCTRVIVKESLNNEAEYSE